MIVQISSINFIFVFNSLFDFCYKNSQNCIEILEKVRLCRILSNIYEELYEKLKGYLL